MAERTPSPTTTDEPGEQPGGGSPAIQKLPRRKATKLYLFGLGTLTVACLGLIVWPVSLRGFFATTTLSVAAEDLAWAKQEATSPERLRLAMTAAGDALWNQGELSDVEKVQERLIVHANEGDAEARLTLSIVGPNRRWPILFLENLARKLADDLYARERSRQITAASGKAPAGKNAARDAEASARSQLIEFLEEHFGQSDRVDSSPADPNRSVQSQSIRAPSVRAPSAWSIQQAAYADGRPSLSPQKTPEVGVRKIPEDGGSWRLREPSYGAAEPTREILYQRLQELRSQHDRLTPEHPQAIELQWRINEIERQIERTLPPPAPVSPPSNLQPAVGAPSIPASPDDLEWTFPPSGSPTPARESPGGEPIGSEPPPPVRNPYVESGGSGLGESEGSGAGIETQLAEARIAFEQLYGAWQNALTARELAEQQFVSVPASADHPATARILRSAAVIRPITAAPSTAWISLLILFSLTFGGILLRMGLELEAPVILGSAAEASAVLSLPLTAVIGESEAPGDVRLERRQRVAGWTIRGCEIFLGCVVVALAIFLLASSHRASDFVANPLAAIAEMVSTVRPW